MLLPRTSIWRRDRTLGGVPSRVNPEAKEPYVARVGGYRRGRSSSARPYSHPNNRMRVVTALSGKHGETVVQLGTVKAAPWFAEILIAEANRYEAPRAAVFRFWIGQALFAAGRITAEELKALEVPPPLPVGQVAPGWLAKAARKR